MICCNFFHPMEKSRSVSPWMQKTVRNTLMSIGSNSALSAMLGFIFSLLADGGVVLYNSNKLLSKLETSVVKLRFAKRKLDDFVFFGNKLQVSYAPQFESLSDTQDKLEGRRREVLARLNPAKRSKETLATSSKETPATSSDAMITSNVISAQHLDSNAWDVEFKGGSRSNFPTRISSNEDYFASQSMNRTVNFVRNKLDKIRSSGEHTQAGSASKKQRVDNRRRI
ncbi:RNA-binding protein 48 isoform X3 [Vigna umbellata]|uniref:RNA-binding protein 48 isoform X3 n=1 Tax=Vigna umbellata TaxID=87088 RepID=UPI001F5F2B72|nr:RNA-binding protein 48 isoform X3 [Vigna umbellata]